MSDTTKDGIKVEPGQVWRDLDKRQENRTLTVDKVENGYAWCVASSGRLVRIKVARMHKHGTGYQLVCSPSRGRSS